MSASVADIRSPGRHAIMSRRLHPCEKFLYSRKNYRPGLVRSGEFFYRVHRIEAKQSDEFNLVAIFVNEELRASIAFDVSRGNAWEDFIPQHVLVYLRVSYLRPAMPDSRNHGPLRW
jgi:hypothetical protein